MTTATRPWSSKRMSARSSTAGHRGTRGCGRMLRTMVGRLAAVFALVAAAGVAAGPAPADPGDPCPPGLPPDRFLEGPAELPIGYRTGVGFDDQSNGGRIDEFHP